MSAFNPEISASALMPKDLLGHASSLHLAMHVCPGLVEVAVSEAAGGEIHWSNIFNFQDVDDDTTVAKNFIRDRNWNERVFRKCTVSYDTIHFALIPKAFYDPKRPEEVLQFISGLEKNAATTALELPEMDAVLLAELPHWTNSLSADFPNVRFIPAAGLFLRYALSLAKNDKDSMHLCHLGNAVLIAVFRGKKLLLFNGYPAHGEEDVLYYASNAAMRLQVDFENALVTLCELPGDLKLTNLLRHYCRELVVQFDGESTSHSFLSKLHVLCA